jgi:hypothetical protein
MNVDCGGPTSDPSLLKLKLSVTVDFSMPAGGFQQDMMAAPTSSIVVRGSACAVSGIKISAAEQQTIRSRLFMARSG